MTFVCGCGSESAELNPSGNGTAAPAPVDDGSSGTTAPSGEGDGTSSDEMSRDDLSDEALIEWSGYSEVSEQVLRFSFTQGNPECVGIRTVVDEDNDQVRVAVLEGTLPDAPANCAAVAMEGTVLVKLAGPLDNRIVRELPEAEAGAR